MRPSVLAVVLAAACAVPPDGDVESAEGKEDRGGGPAFLEVDATRSSAGFRRYVGGALAHLEAHPAPIARLTARSIREGRVRVDEIADLTCWDFSRLLDDLGGVDLEPADWQDLRDGDGAVEATVAAGIDGFMWSNRIYVARGLSTRRLAATLVHEVNHVINRSEHGYYDDLPTSAFLHEYRAFHAERLVDPASYEDLDLVEHVIELYELDGALIPEAILADPLTPRLLPDASAWRERRVEDDAADHVEDCPGLR
jgi:hypothetical protein